MKKILQKWPPLVLTARHGRVVLRPVEVAGGQGFRLQPVRPVARRFQWPPQADGFRRAQFAPRNPRETNAQHRAVEGLERTSENHPRHRMAGERDDESRRRRRLAGVSRGQSRFDFAAETAGARRGKEIRRQALFVEPDPAVARNSGKGKRPRAKNRVRVTHCLRKCHRQAA